MYCTGGAYWAVNFAMDFNGIRARRTQCSSFHHKITFRVDYIN